MKANDVMGIIFSNAYDSVLPELTNRRTMGSVPFGGRYRLIDFALSNMVNCGIGMVGIITKSNYQSLMDHIGNGKPWDLSRKNEGMYILPPFSSADGVGVYKNRIEALRGSMSFIHRSKQEYVVMCDCNVVGNIDIDAVLKAHTKTNADITIAYQNGIVPDMNSPLLLDLDETGRITGVSVYGGRGTVANHSVNLYVMRKSLLERLINEAESQNYDDFKRDIIQRQLNNLKIFGFELKGFLRVIDSLQSYYNINMDLLDKENRQQLFIKERPIFTKVRDDMPTIYGLGSNVTSSLAADGCIIDGEVKNSIIFRGVRIAKGAVVENSVIMQDTYVGEDARLNCIIADKSVVIKPNKVLCGDKAYPIYIGKEIII